LTDCQRSSLREPTAGAFSRWPPSNGIQCRQVKGLSLKKAMTRKCTNIHHKGEPESLLSATKDFPWTMGWQPNCQSQTQIYAKYILKQKPNRRAMASLLITGP
jgi:hypothetical protein